ncbi:hypothetical protein RSPO_c01603 [Ralstonia solanacearum Po82]|uniref:Uncharacterized protein n=1 Tax=Ralstonia solanacearum (strain Po82) TaxID=1031711 RepID=F6G199_RALS8|nr:hypothetical protein RSPO_c01603 [Ralstonia solanacearum Po82]
MILLKEAGIAAHRLASWAPGLMGGGNNGDCPSMPSISGNGRSSQVDTYAHRSRA